MAKKAKAKTRPKRQQKNSPQPAVMAVPSEAEFGRIVRSVRSHEKDKDAAVGSLRQVIATGVEKHHLDKRAFAIFRSLAKLSNKQLATTLAHLDHYREVGGLEQRATEQEQMFNRDAELTQAKVAIERVAPPKRKRGNGRQTDLEEKIRQAAESTIAPPQVVEDPGEAAIKH